MIRRNDDDILRKAIMMEVHEWEAKARTAKIDMKEAGRRECEESRVKGRGSC